MRHPLPAKFLRRPLCWVATLCLLAMPLLANAQNLITNGTFDTNVAGWAYGVWDGTRDANNDPHSGSNQIVAPYQSDNSGLYSSQCVAVTAGQNYILSAQVLIPSALTTTTSGYAELMADWYPDSTCASGNYTSRLETSHVVSSDGLDNWHGVGASQTAPPGTHSALIVVFSYAYAPGGQFTANFDNIVFEAQPAAPAATATAPAAGPVALVLCALLILVAVGGHLRRTSHR